MVHKYGPISDGRLRLHWQPLYWEDGVLVFGSGSKPAEETVEVKRILETIQLHDVLEAPLTNIELRLLARGLELLHGINSSYRRNNTELALELQHLLGFALDRLTMLVVPAKQVLEEALTSVVSGWSRMQITLSGKWTGAELAREDAVAAASLAEIVLSGPATKQRYESFDGALTILTQE